MESAHKSWDVGAVNDLGASYESAVVDFRGWKDAGFTINLSNNNDAVGEYEVHVGATADALGVMMLEDGTTSAITVASGDELVRSVVIPSPFMFAKVVYTRTSGGGGADAAAIIAAGSAE